METVTEAAPGTSVGLVVAIAVASILVTLVMAYFVDRRGTRRWATATVFAAFTPIGPLVGLVALVVAQRHRRRDGAASPPPPTG